MGKFVGEELGEGDGGADDDADAVGVGVGDRDGVGVSAIESMALVFVMVMVLDSKGVGAIGSWTDLKMYTSVTSQTNPTTGSARMRPRPRSNIRDPSPLGLVVVDDVTRTLSLEKKQKRS